MIRALIIDDETNARNAVKNMLNFYCKNIEVIGEADSIESGVKSINKFNPDLVFLDMKLPDGTGFDLLNSFKKIEFKIIFVTAYNQFAVQAFKFSAIDYLLKPINPKEFVEAVTRAEQETEKNEYKVKLEAFFSNLKPGTAGRKKIVLKTAESIHLINTDEIIRCESDKGYTEFFLQNGKKILVSKVLKEYDELLSAYGFIRTHQSHLINVNYIESFQKEDGGYILMKDQAAIPVSNRKKESILKLFEKL